MNAQLRIIWSQWAVHFAAGRCHAMREVAQRFSRVAARSPDVAPQLFSERLVAPQLFCERLLGAASLIAGEFEAAQQHLSRVINSSVPPPICAKNTASSPAPIFGTPLWAGSGPSLIQSILARALLARALCLTGCLDQAVAHAQESLDDGRSQDLSYAQAEVLRLAVCPVALLIGDLAEAELGVAMYREVAENINAANQLRVADCFEGELLIMRREFASGVATLRAAMNTLEPAGWTISFPEYLGAVTQGLAGLGRLDEALATLEQAFAWAERSGERWYLAELLRIKGELLLQQEHHDGVAAAEDTFKRALELAREQGALLWELRTALSLARHCQKSGRSGEAQGLLEPVYARFSEGLATPDLRAARELLESASGGHRGALHLVK
jgi:predicted ATPase